MRTFYAVQFQSGRNTTTGQPNKRTGRMDIACHPVSFTSEANRDTWVKQGRSTTDMRGNCREAVTLKELRKLKRGHTETEFAELIETLKAFKVDE